MAMYAWKHGTMPHSRDVTQTRFRHDVAPRGTAKPFLSRVKISFFLFSGLTFPISRVSRLLRAGKFASLYRKNTGIFLAGALEYLTAELVDLAANAAKDIGKKRITPRAINLAIRGDVDFNALLSEALVSQGGVLPRINKVLIKGKKKKKSKKGKKGKKSKKSKSGSPKKAKSPKKKKSKGKKKTSGKKKSGGKKKSSKKSKKKSGGKKSGGKKSKKSTKAAAAASQEA